MKRSIWPIALLTLKEGLRHRILYGVLVFASLVLLFTILASGLFMRDVQKVILDISLSAVSLAGLLIPFFLTISLLSRDIEQWTAFTILAKPISRSHYIFGKYLGISLLTFVVIAVLSGFTLLTIQLSQFIYPVHLFSDLNYCVILIACFMIFASILVLNSCVFFWCSITTSSFLATLLAITTYLIGQTSEDLVRFMSLENSGVSISPVTQKTVQAALYIFPNLAAFDFKHQAGYGLIISSQEVAFSVIYAVAYISAMLMLSMLIFTRRDLS